MSSGRTHDRITLWTLPLVVLLAFRITLDGWLTGIVCLGFLLGGWLLGPDLDIHSVQYKRWGWFRWIWLPYRKSMRHRSRWSHGPVIGTLIRVIYLSGWLALAGVVAVDVLNSLGRTALTWDGLVDGVGWHLRNHWPHWLALVVGLELGALSHYVADGLSSAWKQRTKRRPTAAGGASSRKGAGSANPTSVAPKNRRSAPDRDRDLANNPGKKKKRPSR